MLSKFSGILKFKDKKYVKKNLINTKISLGNVWNCEKNLNF